MHFDMNDAVVLSIDADRHNDYDVLKSKKTVMNVFD